ncbi:MAG: SDR family NAD(P)-dependent oxidoreductase, partial [Spirillospora sp.]
MTGAAGGIGAATVEALTGSGHRVAALDLDAGRLRALADGARERGLDVVGHAVDVGDAPAVEAVFDKVETELGPVTDVV